MNVLLGICDERVIDATKTCFRDNKIGGSPVNFLYRLRSHNVLDLF